jgi:hypothetical protein
VDKDNNNNGGKDKGRVFFYCGERKNTVDGRG